MICVKTSYFSSFPVLCLVALFASSVSGQACTTEGGVVRNINPLSPLIVQSPKYPENFVSDLSCRWNINVPVGYRFRVLCEDFSLTSTPNCQSDVVTINGKKYCSGPTLDTKWNGGQPLIIDFQSRTNSGKFKCTVSAIEDPCNCGNVKKTDKDKYNHVALIKNSAGVFCGASISE